jgi:predicted nucleotidyltransferase
MDLKQLVREKREEILQVAAKHGAYNVPIFGSVARGEAGLDSDVDFLVEMEADRSLFDLAGLLADLQDLLNRKVDVAEPEGLHWFIRDQILKEAVPL